MADWMMLMGCDWVGCGMLIELGEHVVLGFCRVLYCILSCWVGAENYGNCSEHALLMPMPKSSSNWHRPTSDRNTTPFYSTTFDLA